MLGSRGFAGGGGGQCVLPLGFGTIRNPGSDRLNETEKDIEFRSTRHYYSALQ